MPYQPCPICSAPAKSVCRCKRSDTVCKNGHDWHICPVHDVPVIGKSDHAVPMTQCSCKTNPGFAGPPLLADSKWRYGVASILLGSTAILVLGQPTLFQIFSDTLEVRLWDTGDIVRNNLIAMGAILGILVLWKKLRP